MNGKVYVKRMGVPEDPQELSISATYAVHDDCAVDQAFVLELLPPGASIKYRGVLFDQGKQAYNVPMGIYFGDTMVAPELPVSCLMTRIGQ